MTRLLLSIFIYVDVFVIGVLSAITFRHGHAHFRPDKHEDDEKPHLSKEVKERLLQDSELQYRKALENSVTVLQQDLEYSAQQINGLVTRFAGVIVGDEMEKYRSGLAKLHEQAEAEMGGVRQEMAGHQAEIEANYKAEMEIEKKRLIEQIDLKLGDAVASFLVETLQHNVDLGSQGEYLMTLLEEHKSEFSKILTTPEPGVNEVLQKTDLVIKQEVPGGQAQPTK